MTTKKKKPPKIVSAGPAEPKPKKDKPVAIAQAELERRLTVVGKELANIRRELKELKKREKAK